MKNNICEWVITGNDMVVYKDADEERTRRCLESLRRNYPVTIWKIYSPTGTEEKV
jgi:hypothetical protein